MRFAKRMLLFFCQLLVLAPLAVNLLALLRGHLLELFVPRTHLRALFWVEARPLLHLRLQALLLLCAHLRVALGDLDPLVATLGLDVSPVVGKWGEDALLLRRELRPFRPVDLRAGLNGLCASREEQTQREYGR